MSKTFLPVSQHGNFTFDGNALMAVIGGFDPVLIASLRVREKTDNSEKARRCRTNAATKGRFGEPDCLSNLIFMGIHYLPFLDESREHIRDVNTNGVRDDRIEFAGKISSEPPISKICMNGTAYPVLHMVTPDIPFEQLDSRQRASPSVLS